MLYFDKQPSGKSRRQLAAYLQASEKEKDCSAPDESVSRRLETDRDFDRAASPQNALAGEDFSTLGDRPIAKDRTLVEELFSFDGPPDATVSVGGQEYYYFSGEGYLGLQANPEVLAATCEAVLHYGTSLGTIRRRYTPAPVFEVERQTAEIYGTDKALYCQNETAAAERLLESIADSFEIIFADELVGDALFAAAERVLARTGSKPIVFRNRDAGHLKELLKKHLPAHARPLVLTDGVFNVTGAIAPIPDYYSVLADYHDSALLIDDSEGLGVLGAKGRGTLEYFEYDLRSVNETRQDGEGDPTFGIGYCPLPSEPFAERLETELGEDIFDDEELPETDRLDERSDFIFLEPEEKKVHRLKPLPTRTYLVASLARAIGGFGAVIPGSERFIDRLRHRTALTDAGAFPPTPLAAATRKGLQLSFHHDVIRHRLWDNVYYFKSEIEKLGLATEGNMVPIVSIRVGSDRNMRRLQRELINDQILVSFLQRMNARCGDSSIRVALFATHQRVMLDLFLESLQRTL